MGCYSMRHEGLHNASKHSISKRNTFFKITLAICGRLNRRVVLLLIMSSVFLVSMKTVGINFEYPPGGSISDLACGTCVMFPMVLVDHVFFRCILVFNSDLLRRNIKDSSIL